MSIIKPFKGLRPKPELAKQVASLPYDVMNSTEAREMVIGNPLSFLHVSKAEIDLPADTDVHSQKVYDKAKENFQQLIQEGVLLQDAQKYFYIYAQVMNGRRQIGLVACSSIDDYFNDVIKKHEYTRPEKEKDRIDHMETLQAHVGPIFLTYPKNNTVDSLISKIISDQKPVYDLQAEDGIQHTVWIVQNNADIDLLSDIFNREIPFTYIADGHHRAASAAKVGKKMREKMGNSTGEEEFNFFLSVLFPDDQLAIMDYNRVVKDLNGLPKETFLEKLQSSFFIEPVDFGNCKPAALHEFALYIEKQWYQLKAKETAYTSDPIGILDVTILQEKVLKPLLGIEDPRTDTRIDFIGGIRGLKELERRVDKGEMAVAFALYPVSLQQLMDIADSGNVMPPKSTWFEPKLRDGLLSHLF